MTRPTQSAPEECAVCGSAIPARARACPECGADERTGWRESSVYDGVDLPDDNDARPDSRSAGGLPWYWLAVAVGLLLAIGLAVFGLR